MSMTVKKLAIAFSLVGGAGVAAMGLVTQGFALSSPFGEAAQDTPIDTSNIYTRYLKCNDQGTFEVGFVLTRKLTDEAELSANDNPGIELAETDLNRLQKRVDMITAKKPVEDKPTPEDVKKVWKQANIIKRVNNMCPK